MASRIPSQKRRKISSSVTTRDWSALPHDLLVQIAKRVGFIDDFIAFGAVCRSWQRAASKENFNTSSPASQMPWVIFPGSTPPELFNISKGVGRDIPIPEIDGRICFASQGWIVIVYRDWHLSLLRPLSRTQIQLPCIKAYKNAALCTASEMYKCFVRKVAVSSNRCQEKEPSVMAIYGSGTKLAYLEGGHESWTPVESPRNIYQDVIWYKNQFYVVDCRRQLQVVRITNAAQVVAELILLAHLPAELVDEWGNDHYLVESEGELLMVIRSTIRRSEWQISRGFQVFQVDLRADGVSESWKKVKGLGNRAIFIGLNSSFSIEASHGSGCMPNCIYFLNYYRKGFVSKRLEIFNMEDGRIRGHSCGSAALGPMWLTLDF